MHPVRAEYVGDLVWVGDDRGRPERKDEPRELVYEELRRLEVHVGVDEAGYDPAPRGIERRVAFVLTEACDPAVDDRDVRLQPFAREDGQHLAAADDEVGRLVAARHGQTLRKGCVH